MRLNVATETADRLRHFGYNMGMEPTNPIHVKPGVERIVFKGDAVRSFFPYYINAGKDADRAINDLMDAMDYAS